MSSPRKALMFTLEHEDSVITIMKPMSGEFTKQVIVVYEDAYGEVDMRLMTPQGVSSNYGVDLQEIELFIGERETEKF